MAFIDNVKQWFKTGDYPTQAQFYQKFAWLRWKDEPVAFNDLDTVLQIQINAIRNKQEVVTSANFTVLVAAKLKIESLDFLNESVSAMTIRIGATPGGNEYGEETVSAGGDVGFGIGKTMWVDTTIYVTGITGQVTCLIDRK